MLKRSPRQLRSRGGYSGPLSSRVLVTRADGTWYWQDAEEDTQGVLTKRRQGHQYGPRRPDQIPGPVEPPRRMDSSRSPGSSPETG